MLLISPVASWALEVTLVYDENSRYQSSFATIFSTNIASNKNITLSKIPTTSFSVSTLRESLPDIIVNLDNESGEKIMASNLKTSVFHALITVATSRKFAPCLPLCLKSLPLHRFFVLDQPSARQLSLIQLISPTFKNIGVIVTKQSAPQLKLLKESARQKNLIINEHISNSDNVRYQIDDVSRSSDIILAIADTSIYNATSLSQILLTSYRYRTPIIGFSKGFIKAGAIAGTVSSIEQLAQQLAESITHPETLKLTASDNIVYPKYFNVVTNRNVAKSLNLHFPEDNVLKKQLQADENTQ